MLEKRVEAQAPELKLRVSSSNEWLAAVLADFDSFLLDHAAAEKKAAGMASSMLSHYPDKTALVTAMIDLAIEEMAHFKEVHKIMIDRELILGADTKDEYVNRLRKAIRNGKEEYFLDRLLVAGIVEARGCERFGMIADALPEGKLKKFYRVITDSEAKHENLFLELAREYFSDAEISPRLDELLVLEAEIVSSLPIKAALH